MKYIPDIFSNREIAILIWLIALLLFFILNKTTREPSGGLIKLFFGRQIFTIFCLMTLYVFGIIYLLYKLSFWNNELIKDTVFWFCTVAIVMFFNTNKVDNKKYFKKILLDAIKWTGIIEFVMNFYTFSLPVELILVPLLTLIGATKVFAEVSRQKIENREQVIKLLENILSIIGILFILFVIYKTIAEYNQLFTFINLKSLLLPPILTVLFLPFIYFLALYMKYETLFIRIGFMINKKEMVSTVKCKIFLAANFNLNKINKIEKNITKAGFYDNENLSEYLKEILK